MGHKHLPTPSPLPCVYKDLRSGQGTLHQIFARDWQRFVDSLSPEAVVARQSTGLWIPVGAKLLEVGSVAVQSKHDVPRIPPSHKPQWVRLADPSRTELHLCNESRQALTWLSARFQHDQLRALRQSPLLRCMAAADAMAEGDTVGIGGWISPSSDFFWFSESWTMTEIRSHWPQLAKPAQPYIACFETLAQLALAMIAHRRLHSRHFNLRAAHRFRQHRSRSRHQQAFHHQRTSVHLSQVGGLLVSTAQRASRCVPPRRREECLGR